MIVTVNLFDVIVLAVGALLLLACGLVLAIEYIKQRKKK